MINFSVPMSNFSNALLRAVFFRAQNFFYNRQVDNDFFGNGISCAGFNLAYFRGDGKSSNLFLVEKNIFIEEKLNRLDHNKHIIQC